MDFIRLNARASLRARWMRVCVRDHGGPPETQMGDIGKNSCIFSRCRHHDRAASVTGFGRSGRSGKEEVKVDACRREKVDAEALARTIIIKFIVGFVRYLEIINYRDGGSATAEYE